MPPRRAQVKHPVGVFINCPFDADYRPIFRAVVFTVTACGFTPRCTLEHEDASQERFEKICRLIEKCALGIHDISRTEPDADNGLPRFNMPLELGIFLGAKRFGGARHVVKRCLVLDRERYRFQKFISDLGGKDIKSHQGVPENAISAVRDWLRGEVAGAALPGGSHLASRYQRFTEEMPVLCGRGQLDPDQLTFPDFQQLVRDWLVSNR